MRPATVLAVVATAVLCGCAGQTPLPTIPNGDNVVILVAMDPQADGKFNIRNEALGAGVSSGAGTGIVAGGLWGLTCGPLAVLCVPLAAMTGAFAGSAAGAVVGVTGALSDEKAEKLRERVRRVSVSHPIVADLQSNIADRARKYWNLSADNLGTKLTVHVRELQLMSTRDEQIRCAVRVSVSLEPTGGKPAKVAVEKQYEYLGAYSSLAVWLDESSEFVDTVLASASQQLAAQIVADLAVH